MKQPAGSGEKQNSDRVSRRDHFSAADRVEKMAKNNRAEDVSERERQKIITHVLRGNVIEPHQNQAIGKEDGVVEKGLGQHEDETENGTPAMLMHGGFPDLATG